MNWLDYVLIVVLTVSALRSFQRGFTREIVGLCAAIAAFVLGMWFYGVAGSLVRQWVGSDRVANLIGFVMVVIAVLLIGAIVGRIVRGFVKAVGLSFFDRLLGALFGLIRGALVAAAMLTAYMAFGPGAQSWDSPSARKTAPGAMVHSQIAPYLMEASRIFVDAAPMELKRSFREGYGEMKAEIRRLGQSDTKDVKDPGAK